MVERKEAIELAIKLRYARSRQQELLKKKIEIDLELDSVSETINVMKNKVHLMLKVGKSDFSNFFDLWVCPSGHRVYCKSEPIVCESCHPLPKGA